MLNPQNYRIEIIAQGKAKHLWLDTYCTFSYLPHRYLPDKHDNETEYIG